MTDQLPWLCRQGFHKYRFDPTVFAKATSLIKPGWTLDRFRAERCVRCHKTQIYVQQSLTTEKKVTTTTSPERTP